MSLHSTLGLRLNMLLLLFLKFQKGRYSQFKRSLLKHSVEDIALVLLLRKKYVHKGPSCKYKYD